MKKESSIQLFVFIVSILIVCIILRLFPTIELSGVTDIEETMKEIEVTRVQPDIKEITKDKKNKKKKYKVVDNVIYEEIDNKYSIDNNAITDIEQSTVEVEIANIPIAKNTFDWESYEPNEDDLILPDNIKDEEHKVNN